MRALVWLTDANKPGRELVEERLNKLKNEWNLPRDKGRAQSELLGLQVAARSPMGAFAYERRHHDRRQLAARA